MTAALPEWRAAHLIAPRPRLDPRCDLARPDLVEIDLAGVIAAARYVAPLALRASVPQVMLRKAAAADSVAVSELLLGEDFDVFDAEGDWLFGRNPYDRYLGWVPAAAVAPRVGDAGQAITARSAPCFAQPDIKAPVTALLPFGARVTPTIEGKFAAVAGGFVHLAHLAPLRSPDPLRVAQRFAGAPYVWGGRTPAGVDCSGLVQAALAACGVKAPRDSDQQLAALGSAIAFNDRAAGDLIFFPGHVGILSSRDRLFHANAHWMTTLDEPLADVIARLHAAGVAEPVSGVRRL